MPRIIFLTLYLGLIAGRQPIALQVDGPIKTVRLLLDDAQIGTLIGPSWRTTIDLGDTVLPRELVAVGVDENGNELARAKQILNLPRPAAETEIAFTNGDDGVPKRATLTGRHIAYLQPYKASLKVDDVDVPLDKQLSARLPRLDMKRPHVFAAEMKFDDGAVARREEVVGGQFGETVPSELTALAVRATSEHPTPGDCLVSNGEPLRITSIEKAPANLIIVRDPLRRRSSTSRNVGVVPGIEVQFLSPIADRIRGSDETTFRFPLSAPRSEEYGLLWLIAHGVQRNVRTFGPRQWADAVAVAGVRAMEGGRRRAVLLVLEDAADGSLQSPRSARAYLKSIGVPLFVWTLGSSAQSADWGDVTDVSSPEKLIEATKRIRSTFDEQRIAWVDADPFTALRATVKEGCGFTR